MSQASESGTSGGMKTYTGGCHCGVVRFEVDIDLGSGISRCNCSICTKTAVTGGIVKPSAFRLLAGEDRLKKYEWASKMSTRYFCGDCGIHCFGRGHLAELGGDFVSINVNTLDDVELSELKLVHWDGRHNNWEAGPRDTPWPIRG
jgi:hypothetical protein